MRTLCTICTELLSGSDSESACCTPCGHIFHSNCLIDRYQRNRTCPHCRRVFSLTNIVRLFFSLESADLANDETSKNLQKKVEKLSRETELKDHTIANLQVNNGILTTENRKLVANVKCLEDEKRINEEVTKSLKRKVKLLETKCQDLSIKLFEAETDKQMIESLKEILLAPKCNALAGEYGKTIQKINRQTGAHCEFEPRDGKKRTCINQETVPQIDMAKDVIDEKLGMPSCSSSNGANHFADFQIQNSEAEHITEWEAHNKSFGRSKNVQGTEAQSVTTQQGNKTSNASINLYPEQVQRNVLLSPPASGLSKTASTGTPNGQQNANDLSDKSNQRTHYEARNGGEAPIEKCSQSMIDDDAGYDDDIDDGLQFHECNSELNEDIVYIVCLLLILSYNQPFFCQELASKYCNVPFKHEMRFPCKECPKNFIFARKSREFFLNCFKKSCYFFSNFPGLRCTTNKLLSSLKRKYGAAIA